MRGAAWLRAAWMLGGLAIPTAHASPPIPASESGTAALEGRVRESGRRTPVVGAKLLIVAAPDDVVAGRPAIEPLDPAEVEWIREVETDGQGEFVIPDLPIGKVRVVVVAPGYERIDLWASVQPGARSLTLFLDPRPGSEFRTEVVSDRDFAQPEPGHRVTTEQARVYPGSGGDPVRAVQNMPGVARSPGGLGMLAIRGGDPRQTGVYVDGHPVSRAFHVLPIAAIVAPGQVESVELTPGNYDAAFGGHGAGLLELRTRSGPLAGSEDRAIHGEAHLDLFDVGAGVSGPVGPGAITFGFRRAHVGEVIEGVDRRISATGILIPGYWDYLGRFDMPIGRGHRLTLKILGAGDELDDIVNPESSNPGIIAFSTAFHRFDLGYQLERGRWHFEVSGALGVDRNSNGNEYYSVERDAWTISLRTSLRYQLSSRATLLAGANLVDEHWARHSRRVASGEVDELDTDNRDLAFGAWLGVALRFDPKTGPVVVRPQVRLQAFTSVDETRVLPDPRIDLRARLHPKVELLAAIGQYSYPVVGVQDSAGLLEPEAKQAAVIIDVPPWLAQYFDPGSEYEVATGLLMIARVVQASLGAEVELPWRLGLRATGFWRENGSQQRGWVEDTGWLGLFDNSVQVPAARAYGLELLLRRELARDVHGWIGYSLLRSQMHAIGEAWGPTVFDQRHNLVALISVGLPRNFRFGARFRVVSGNPDTPVIGTIVSTSLEGTYYSPIRGKLGSVYRPTFHQLDLRIDKTWYLKWLAVSAYVDIQNVYNNQYPEVWVYSIDWTERQSRIGLPIFPSLGLRVEY